MKKYFKPRFLLVSLLLCNIMSIYSQKTDKITINRDNIPPQAVIELESSEKIYVGQEYNIIVGISGDFDVKIEVENGKISFDEESRRSTGGLRYTLIPTKTGECFISVWIITKDNDKVNLLSRRFVVENFPSPSIFINTIQSGSIINKLSSETKISCKYPPVYGVYDNYEIKNWSVNVGDKIFTGTGDQFTKELIKYVNETSSSHLYIKVELMKNITNHYFSEGIFIVK